MRSSSKFINRLPTVKNVKDNSVGGGTGNLIALDACGVDISEELTDTTEETLIEVDESEKGYLYLLWVSSPAGSYTAGDAYRLRLYINGSIVATQIFAPVVADSGTVFVGSYTDNGTNNHPFACDFVPFTRGFKVTIQASIVATTLTPNVRVAYILLD